MPLVQARGSGVAQRPLWGVSFLFQLPCLQVQEAGKRATACVGEGDKGSLNSQPNSHR